MLFNLELRYNDMLAYVREEFPAGEHIQLVVETLAGKDLTLFEKLGTIFPLIAAIVQQLQAARVPTATADGLSIDKVSKLAAEAVDRLLKFTGMIGFFVEAIDNHVAELAIKVSYNALRGKFNKLLGLPPVTDEEFTATAVEVVNKAKLAING